MSYDQDRERRPKRPTKGREPRDFKPKDAVVPAGTTKPERTGFFRGARVKSTG